MSERGPGDQQPLAPRRTLAAPGGTSTDTSAVPDSPTPESEPESKPQPKTESKPKARRRSTPKSATKSASRSTARSASPPAAQPAATAEPAAKTEPAQAPRRVAGRRAATQPDEGQPTASMPRVTDSSTPPPYQHPQAIAPLSTSTPDSASAPAERPRRTSRAKQTRRARLRMVRIDPWSVMKMAFALSIALAVVIVVAVAIVWSVLDAAGVWEAINSTTAQLVSPRAGAERFDVEDYVGLERVMGFALVLSAANIVLVTALATLAAFMYNLAAALLGGFEVTLAEDR